eukprot:gnl/TRDRNA2_/TRDRNA2_42241_c0_seq1.p1 gnl/TRDRNA2_/TRDRNA2_42241_c0~~gnl/TRDRNA2_/TRDRNA2_42241_c0_seq1.p1  ORF type:complete len:514 (-),score=77.61 gnl/TRDRNA2_/TRDRNA2_42241_c0_seq1:124-1665(-)
MACFLSDCGGASICRTVDQQELRTRARVESTADQWPLDSPGWGVHTKDLQESYVFYSASDARATAGAAGDEGTPESTNRSYGSSDKPRARVRYCGCSPRRLTWLFTIELQDANGMGRATVQRTYAELERVHRQVKHEYASVQRRQLAFPHPCPLFSLLPLPGCQRRSEDRLEQWLNEVLDAGLLCTSEPLMRLLGIGSSSPLRKIYMSTDAMPRRVCPSPASPDFSLIAELPLLHEIVDYFDKPSELAALCGCASKSIAQHSGYEMHPCWEILYKAMWPAFHECMKYHRPKGSWRDLYRDTIAGLIEFPLEVFEREKKCGFSMSALAAGVTWEADLDAYIARYLSACPARPEAIPRSEMHRLRFCPPSACAALQPKLLPWPEATPSGEGESGTLDGIKVTTGYPYKVLQGSAGLRPGMGVELQWKMQRDSPLGWWYGTLESITHEGNGSQLATAVITFRHFPASSRWYRLQLTFGDDQVRPCAIGGYSGGLRAATEEEEKQWKRFLPKEPLVL